MVFATGDAGSAALKSDADSAGNVTRISTRAWAKQSDYDPIKLFTKFFSDDIKYLLSMDKLWQKRTPPTPLSWDAMSETGKLCVYLVLAIKSLTVFYYMIF